MLCLQCTCAQTTSPVMHLVMRGFCSKDVLYASHAYANEPRRPCRLRRGPEGPEWPGKGAGVRMILLLVGRD